MYTKRDQDIYNFIEDFHVATFKQIYNLFFFQSSLRYAQKRMQTLSERKFFKRTRSTIDNSIAYYINKEKPVQMHHDLLRSELFVKLSQYYKIEGWSNETTIVNIRPDALAFIKLNKSQYIKYNNEKNENIIPVFIEIHLNNKFNFQKYIDLLKNNNIIDIFGYMPMVLIYTDRNNVSIPDIGIKFKVIDINTNVNKLQSIFS